MKDISLSAEAYWLPLASRRQVMEEIRLRSTGLWRWLWAGLALMIFAAFMNLAVPMAMGWIVDEVIAGRRVKALLWPALALGAAIVSGAAATGFGQAFTASYASMVLTRLREDLVDKALRLDQQTIERAGSADLVSRSGDDLTSVREAATTSLPRLVSTGSLTAVAVAGIGALHWAFLFPLSLVVVVYAIVIRDFLRKAPENHRAERLASTRLSAHILANLYGIDAVQAFDLRRLRLSTVQNESWEATRLDLRGRFLANTLVLRLLGGEALAVVSVLGVACILVVNDQVSMGKASAAALVLVSVFGPLRFLLMFFDGMQASYVALQRVVGVVVADDPPERRASVVPEMNEAVRVCDVWFSYQPENEVLRGVSFSIQPGEHVALIGSSGAGKSTLALVVAGLVKAQHGEVYVRPSPKHAGPMTVLVSQDVHTFSGPLIDDVSLGLRGEYSDADVVRRVEWALDKVGASSWARPGMVVGRFGQRLTPMQAQQLALARVLLADPGLVILDEATAEAGSVGAAILDRAAAAVLEGRTALVIAHRFSQVVGMDRVMVMDEGRIIEDGSPAELMESGGVFARLCATWTAQRGVVEENT